MEQKELLASWVDLTDEEKSLVEAYIQGIGKMRTIGDDCISAIFFFVF